jgi:phosphoribosylanthranilate isomerase
VASPRIKFCGITSLSDARLAVEAGAWALGTILWPGSERRCDPAEAARIAAELRRQAEIAGVFVNQPLDEVIGLADGIGLSLVQLHGDEGPSFCAEVARRTGAKVIKAARIRSGSDVQAMEAFHTDFHLLDTHSMVAPGGTGESFDWRLAKLHGGTPPLVLSGGLNAGNVGEAIAAVHPFAVDSASGTEAEPGRKDPAKLEAFFEAVAAADDRIGAPA